MTHGAWKRPRARSGPKSRRLDHGPLRAKVSELLRADRAVPGHWEGDLLLGGTSKGAVITLVERSSRFVLLAPLPGRHTADLARMSLAEMIATLSLELRKSITRDRGSETAEHAQFKTDTGIQI